MKRISVVTGAVLLLGGLYVVVGEHLSGTSADATINARISVLRAPIEGTVTFAAGNIGTVVSDDETIARITDERFDTARLIDLERARASLGVDLDRVKAQTVAVTEARRVMQDQAKDYQNGRIRQIEARLGEAQAAQNSAEAKLREADSALKRTTDLSSRGVQTAITLDRAKADFDVARQEIESTRQRQTYLATELASARNGVFIGDSYNDAPFSTQRIREFDLRLAELSAEAEQINQRLKLSAEQIAAERVRINRLTSADVNVQSSGILWTFLASNGEHVNRGQDLVTIVDCSSLMVTASVSESLYARLKVGMPAQFRLNGDSRIFDATITRLGGAGAASLYSHLTIGPSPEHLTRFDVTLTAPNLSGDPELACAVGRTGRVIFSGGPLTNLRQALSRFGF